MGKEHGEKRTVQATVLHGGRFILHALVWLERSGAWMARCRDAETGRVRNFVTGTADKDKALRSAVQWVGRLEKAARESQQARSIRFDVAFEEYLSAKTVRAATLATYRDDFEGIYKPTFAGKYLPDIQAADIDRFTKGLADRKARDGKPLASRTRQKHLTALRGFWTWAVRRKYTRENPTDGCRVKVKRREKRRGRALSGEEARALLEAARVPDVEPIDGTRTVGRPRGRWLFLAVVLGLHAGLRRKTIVELRWRHVDLGARRLAIPGDILKAGNPADLPIHRELDGILRDELRRLGKVDPDARVIGGASAGSGDALQAAAKRAGIVAAGEHLGWHDLRRTFATRAALAVPHAVLQRLLAHEPESVSDLYPQVPFDELLRAVDALPPFLSAQATRATRKARPHAGDAGA